MNAQAVEWFRVAAADVHELVVVVEVVERDDRLRDRTADVHPGERELGRDGRAALTADVGVDLDDLALDTAGVARGERRRRGVRQADRVRAGPDGERRVLRRGRP